MLKTQIDWKFYYHEKLECIKENSLRVWISKQSKPKKVSMEKIKNEIQLIF